MPDEEKQEKQDKKEDRADGKAEGKDDREPEGAEAPDETGNAETVGEAAGEADGGTTGGTENEVASESGSDQADEPLVAGSLRIPRSGEPLSVGDDTLAAGEAGQDQVALGSSTAEPSGESEDLRRREHLARLARFRNQRADGTLILHYEARDVSFVMDGESAMRMMVLFKRRAKRGGDTLTEDSDATAMWVVYDPTTILAMWWIPGADRPISRVAIDPPAPAALL
jgi:hypothetical protein